MTDDRKRKTGGEVELLPLPEWTYGGNHLRLKSAGLQQRVEAYARANVDRALAECLAIRSDLAAKAHGYMQELEHHKARAERLAELLRQCRDEMAGLPHSLGYDFTHLPKIDAALNLEPRND